MSEITEKLEPYDNPAAGRYEARIDNRLAVSHYRLDGSTITFTHTQVPKGLEGQGIASQLVRFALEDARTRGLAVIPRCPFINGYIKRHPEYQPLVAGGYQLADQAALIDLTGASTRSQPRRGDVDAGEQDDPEAVDDDELLASLDLLGSPDLLADETADPAEAVAEGLAYIPPSDPPILPGKGEGVRQRTAAPAHHVAAEEQPVLQRSPLTADELAGFHERLEALHLAVQGQIESLEEQLRMGDEEAEVDNAPADHGTDLYSREQALGLIEALRADLRQIDSARARMAAGSYGLSEISGRPIPRERLDALPAATTLIEEADAARGNA